MQADTFDIQALMNGDPAARTAFYKAYARTILNWCIRLGGPYVDAEDVAQDVFAKLFLKLHTFQNDRPLRPWLYGFTRRVVANARRRARIRRMVGLVDIPEVPHPGPSTETKLLRLWRRRKLQHALEHLSDKHREVVVLMDIEGRTAPEVAAMLGVSVGTVYSRQHYGRKAFKKALEATLGGTDTATLYAMLDVGERA